MSYKNRAENCIAQGALTNSKHWSSHVEGIYPTHIKASTGAYVIDANNKKYLDFICGLGTNLIGYGHPLVESEVDLHKFEGKSPSLPTFLEVQTAEQLKQMFPWIHRFKFLNSGSEACNAAIKIARAHHKVRCTDNHLREMIGRECRFGDHDVSHLDFVKSMWRRELATGTSQIRSLVLTDAYHGWGDSFVSLTPPGSGVSPHFDILPLKGNEELIPIAALVILEPVITDDSLENLEYLKFLRKTTEDYGTLLCFDEVITGVRFKQHSVAKAYNLRPDLICLGKGLAGGYAISAVGGSKDVMDSDYFVSSTYAGEVSALAACKATAKLLRENPNYNIDRLWEVGAKFQIDFNAMSEDLGFRLVGYGTRGSFEGDPLTLALFFQEACKAGFLFGKSWFISFAHIAHVKHCLFAMRDIFLRMKTQKLKLEGQLPRSPFAQKVRDGNKKQGLQKPS